MSFATDGFGTLTFYPSPFRRESDRDLSPPGRGVKQKIDEEARRGEGGGTIFSIGVLNSRVGEVGVME